MFGMKSLVARLISRTVRTAVKSPSVNHFRPVLEQFESRDVPATYTYIWTYDGGGVGDSDVAANWLPAVGRDSQIPTDDDHLVVPSGTGSMNLKLSAAKSLDMASGYTGVVTFDQDLTVEDFFLRGGAVSQPDSTADLTVTSEFEWTGGTLNNSTYLSTVTITGGSATALFAPTGGGTVNLGSSISLANGAAATVREGTIDLNKAGIEFSTSSGASLDLNPNTATSIILGVSQYLNGLIGSTTIWTVKAGASVTVKGTLTNNGTLALLAGSTATVAGKPMIAVAYSQGVGAATHLHGSSTLATAADKKVILAGGRLATVYDSDVGNANATIRTDVLEVAGTDIYIGYQGGNSRFGELLIDGDVLWSGGTFHTKVWIDGTTCDVWRTTNASGNGAQFDIDAGNTVAPIYVDSDYGTSSLPTSGTDWEILKAGGGFADATGPAVSDTGLWEMEIDDEGSPSIYWKLIAK